MGFINKILFFVGLSVPLAYLGSFGRIIADEYCMCANLLQLEQNVFEAAFSDIMPFSMLVQAIFSHLVILNFGQSIASSLAFLLFFWSTWFVVYRFATWRDTDNGNHYFALSGVVSFAVFVSTLLSAGLLLPGMFEALTQQTFIGQTFFRYPGIPVVHAAHLTLVGIAFWLAGLKKRFVVPSIALSVVVGMLAGLSHYLLAAVFAFLVAAMYWKSILNWRREISLNGEQIARPLGTFVGLGAGLAFSLFSDEAESRISQFEAQYWTVPPTDRLVAIVLDPIWVLASLSSFSVVMGLVMGVLLERRFGLASRLQLKVKPLLKFSLVFLSYCMAVSLLASLVSYSAPWHGIAPRYLIAILSVALGIALAAERLRRFVISRTASVIASLTLMVGAFGITLAWANGLPKAWESGHLPMQTVREGPGSGIIWQDTDKLASLECYLEIEHRLPERKTNLVD